ncbi:hypothetical protein PXH69_32620 [Rhodococcus qingshengii]|uniref:C2H2-type domain-containing protein n=1 Tax=Rhodococcus qingshengii TaxID=334542 RepID=A0AAW6LZF5_RHOSG|nr:hypothetical protein [Rhodococcus qingshengii]
MNEGYFRTQCRHCGDLVYEGPWIPPHKRHHIHHAHRTTCTTNAQQHYRQRLLLTLVGAASPDAH